QDRGVADAEVRLQALLLGGTAPMRPQSSARTRTGQDGSFAIDRPLPPAPHYMVTVEGFELAEPRAYALAAEPAEQSITVVVRPAAAVVAIEGVVVDDLGEPVDGAL